MRYVWPGKSKQRGKLRGLGVLTFFQHGLNTAPQSPGPVYTQDWGFRLPRASGKTLETMGKLMLPNSALSLFTSAAGPVGLP